MASTLLVRMKIGHKLVDAKCLSLLEKNKWGYIMLENKVSVIIPAYNEELYIKIQ